MLEPAPCIGEADRHQSFRDGGVERLTRARLGLAQRRFDLRPAGFDGRQVRRVGRQIEQTRPASGQRLLDAHRVMGPQIVHHDNIPRGQRGAQHLLDIGAKDLRVGRAVDGHHRLEALDAQRPQHGHIRAVVLGHAADDPLPAGARP